MFDIYTKLIHYGLGIIQIWSNDITPLCMWWSYYICTLFQRMFSNIVVARQKAKTNYRFAMVLCLTKIAIIGKIIQYVTIIELNQRLLQGTPS